MIGFICPLTAIAAMADPRTRACVDIEVFFPEDMAMPRSIAEVLVTPAGVTRAPNDIGEVRKGCQAREAIGVRYVPRSLLRVRRVSRRVLLSSIAGSFIVRWGRSLPGGNDPGVTEGDTFWYKDQVIQHQGLPFQRRET